MSAVAYFCVQWETFQILQCNAAVVTNFRKKVASLVKNCLYLINDYRLQRQEPTVTALAIAEDFDLHGIANDLAINNLYNVTYIDEGSTFYTFS